MKTQNLEENKEGIETFKQDSFSKFVGQLLPENEDIQNYVENALMQPNEISRAFYGMSLNELKTFSYLIKAFKIENRTSLNRNFSFNLTDILKDANIPYDKKSYVKTVENLVNKMISVETENEIEFINIFEKAKLDKNTNIVTFAFTESFAKIIERKDGGKFTLLDFEEMINLNSYYSIRFYQLAMSYKGFKGKFRKPDNDWFKENIKDSKNTWLYGYSINQLKILFGITDKYKNDNKNLLTKVIENPFKELSEKVKTFDFKYQIIYKTKTRIAGLIFWTTEKQTETPKTIIEKKEKLITNNFYEFDEQKEKEKIKENQEVELKPIRDLEKKYPEEFANRLENERNKNPSFAIDVVLRKNVYDSMLKDGFII